MLLSPVYPYTVRLPFWQPPAPEAAVEPYFRILHRYPRTLIVAPAPSDADIWWLARFRAAFYARYGFHPRFDALAFHCYRPTAAECIKIGKQFVTWAREWGVTEVWCTEFAFTAARSCNPEYEARMFVAWLEGTPEVTRYSPFVHYLEPGCWYWPNTDPHDNPSLFTARDAVTLTATGQWYRKGP